MIYNINKKLDFINAALNDGDIDQQALEDTMLAIEGEVHGNVIDAVMAIKNMEAFNAGANAEIQRLQSLVAARSKAISSIKSACVKLMQKADIKQVSDDIATVGLRKGSESVVISDDEKVPPEYIRVKVTESPDKTEIKKLIKSGKAVDFADLVRGPTTLTIK